MAVPAYFYPAGGNLAYWDQLRSGFPGVSFAVATGLGLEGTNANPDYQTQITQTRQAGILMLAYVTTSSGAKPLTNAQTEIDHAYAWYGVDGIFFGPGDYAHRIGKLGQISHPDVIAAMRRLAESCRRHQKFWGTIGPGRENYQQAAAYLSQMRKLYQKMGREKTWETYLAGLRSNYKSLRALKEELEKKGL